jgi:hypothetical protein
MYWKHVNTRSSYCVSMVVVYKIWWAHVGMQSDFATLLRHNTTKRLPTPDVEYRQPKHVAALNKPNIQNLYDMIYMIYIYIYLTAIGLTPGGSGTVHIYTQTIHRIQRTEHTYI